MDVLEGTIKIPSADPQIIFTKAPFIQYEQILLDKNLREYLERIMVSKKKIKNGSSKKHLQKTNEISVGKIL